MVLTRMENKDKETKKENKENPLSTNQVAKKENKEKTEKQSEAK